MFSTFKDIRLLLKDVRLNEASEATTEKPFSEDDFGSVNEIFADFSFFFHDRVVGIVP